ncbi:MAG: BamA/TamA family outer membrane protein [Flavobacteriaceae bacterium]
MSAQKGIDLSLAKISLLSLFVMVSSCNTLKKVGDNELLITDNHLMVDGEKIKDEDIESLIIQEPNSTLLGYPLRLNLYNLAKENPDSLYQAWLHKKEGREERLTRLLSKKQVDRLGESFFVKGLGVWLKKVGEPPTILDTLKTQKSLQRLSAYYGNRGYFNNTATFEIDHSSRERRAEVNYVLNLGKPFMIDTVTQKIRSSVIDSIYQLHKEGAWVQQGSQFDLNDFSKERERLTNLFRNSGVYNFQESSINYTILRDTTQAGDDQMMDVQLNIDNLRARNDSTVNTDEYKVYRFDKINIYTDYLASESNANWKIEQFGDYNIYYHDKLRFKPKALTNAIFFKKDSIYREEDETNTKRQLVNLNVFKYPNVNFVADGENQDLEAHVYLYPRPKYSLSTGLDITHSNIQQIGISFSPSIVARNIFKGAENLSLSLRVNMGSSRDENIQDKRFFNLWEYGGDLNLTIPRFWFPFLGNGKLIPNEMLPTTRLSIGTSFQENIGLDKQSINSIYSLNWSPHSHKRHTLELVNLQYVNNLNPDNFFNVYRDTYRRLNEIATDEASDYASVEGFEEFYDELNPNHVNDDDDDNLDLIVPSGTDGFIRRVLLGEAKSAEDFIDVGRIAERQDRLTENNLIFASNYTLNLNNRNGITDHDFYQFRFKAESAGNLLSALSNLFSFKEVNGQKEILDVPYSQYFKTEFDYIKYWDLKRSNVLAFRSFFGIAIPYGNADNIPFVRSYFAGGSNDIRAWQPYSLGPGSTNFVNDFNEANLKLGLNLEYRFPVAGDVNGAIFADAGNIWNVFDNVDDPDANFRGLDSLADIALGTGFGVRYDLTYFLLRLDLGFKTYNPAEEPSKRWFRHYNFGNSVLQIGINYPF